MLTFFTDPYEDELLYGTISRYHYYIGNIDYKDTIRELFGKNSIIPSLYLPCNLEHLVNQIGNKYTSDYIINNHTLIPFYEPFLPKDRKSELIYTMKFQNGQGIYAKLGFISGSTCKKDGIYYCPLCSIQDINKYGEAYIHRIHQIQGVFVCSQHEVILKKFDLGNSNTSRLAFVRLNENLLNLNVEKNSNKFFNKLLKIAKSVQFLFSNDLSQFHKDIVASKYREILCKRGLLTANERVRQRELYEEFVGFYGKEFLSEIQSSIEKDNNYNWLKVVTRNDKRVVHPLRHILFIDFLTDDINSFFTIKNKQYNPFGEGPWPCLNPVVDHYKKDEISCVKITDDYKTRAPVGTFSCFCGFKYSRKGPDKYIDDKYKIGRIKDFGTAWEEKLVEYLEEGSHGLREIARLMKCDPKTITKFDNELGIHYFNKSKINIQETNAPKNKEKKIDMQKYKSVIISTIKDNPSLSRTNIRKLCQKEYSYLYKHDTEWLFNNLPETKDRKKVDNKSHIKVDWRKRDMDVIRAIKKAHINLLSNRIPTRITKSCIGKKLGILSMLEKNLNKLPITAEFLGDITESIQDFQIRRSKDIIDLKLENGSIKLWEIQREAGIRTEAFNMIKDSLVAYLESRGDNH